MVMGGPLRCTLGGRAGVACIRSMLVPVPMGLSVCVGVEPPLARLIPPSADGRTDGLMPPRTRVSISVDIIVFFVLKLYNKDIYGNGGATNGRRTELARESDLGPILRSLRTPHLSRNTDLPRPSGGHRSLAANDARLPIVGLTFVRRICVRARKWVAPFARLRICSSFRPTSPLGGSNS